MHGGHGSRQSGRRLRRSAHAWRPTPPVIMRPLSESSLGQTGGVSRLQPAIASVAPAFELIETRGDSRGSLAKGIPDNLQQKGIVLGTSVPIASLGDLADVRVRLDINDLPADEGTSAAVLGNPVNSVVWLANKLSEFGRSIAAGEIVMTGSFIRQFRVAQGDAFHADFDGVGVVEVRFP